MSDDSQTIEGAAVRTFELEEGDVAVIMKATGENLIASHVTQDSLDGLRTAVINQNMLISIGVFAMLAENSTRDILMQMGGSAEAAATFSDNATMVN